MVSLPLAAAAAVVAVAVAVLLVLALSKLVRHRVRLLRSSPGMVVAAEEKIEAGVSSSADGGGDCKGEGDELVRRLGWGEIERMTGNFSKVIGSGGFSTVYLGRLGGLKGGCGGSGRLCAVKVLRGSERMNLVFRQELDILLRLRHDNIVRIVGCCDEREEGALVFEYVPNGNLQERLHCREKSATTDVLPWNNRLSIAYQLARAIEYLHDSCDLQIVHGDVKSSNILLDEHLNCRLCDFGSAKMGFSASVVPSFPTLSPRAKRIMLGSPGYTDPQYLRTGIASKKNDIYSFGVIVLELITGMEAFVTEKGQMLTTIVADAIQDCSGCVTGSLAEILDPKLSENIDLREAGTMISIARSCLNQSSSLRPSASQIIETMRKEIPSIRFESSKVD